MMFSPSKIGLYFLTFINIYWTLIQTVNAQELTLKPQLNIPKELAQQVISIKTGSKKDLTFYLLTEQGAITRIRSDSSLPTTIVNITNQYPKLLSTTAFALKPSTTEQANILTLYSAHIEPSNPSLRTARISLDNTEQPFELVLTEWQTELDQTEAPSHRELFRIPVPNKNVTINQIDFSPYKKSWQENFGQLFIGITGEEEASQSHFSGAILRITPYKYGFKQYTSVSDNPFIHDTSIIDEAIMVGVGNLQQFFWSKDKTNQLIIHTKNQKTTQLSTIKYDENWLNKKSHSSHTVTEKTANFVFSRNQGAKPLTNRFAFLSVKNNLWQLNGIHLKGNDKKAYKIKELPSLSSDNPANSLYGPLLHYSNSEQLIILDRISGVISQFQSSKAENQPIESTTDSESNSSVIWILFLVIAFAAMLFIIRKKYPQHQYKAAKKLLHSHFGKFEVDKNQQIISLFKRHQTTAELTLHFNEIKHIAVALNDEILCEINAEQAFSNQLEQNVNDKFALEKRKKMIDGYIRSITLTLSTDEEKKHSIYAYLRDGNQRLTKAKYEQVIAQLFDWCWLFSQSVASEDTENRIIKEIIQPVKKRNNQPIKAKQITKEKVEFIEQPSATQESTEFAISQTTPLNNDIETQTKEAGNSDVKANLALVHALNDLVEMKKQGFLTEEEFKESKMKIIHNLTSQNKDT